VRVRPGGVSAAESPHRPGRSLLSTVIDVGSIKVSALNDGEVHLPPVYYPGLDFGVHPELLQADGTCHIPVGCFLIQAAGLTVLVDAGLGPSSIPFPGGIAAAAGLADPPESIAAGGRLPGALAAAGVAPADITTVFLTHLHAGHIGWVAPGGVLFFPDAVVMCRAVEWEAPSTIRCSSMTRASRSFPRPSPSARCVPARNSSPPCRGATPPSA
jgi:glyoxylase-like metal-dependent hydrolase (beta-lactamase superfamily II)